MSFNLKWVPLEFLFRMFILELMESNKECQVQIKKEENQEAPNSVIGENSFSGSQTSEGFSHESTEAKNNFTCHHFSSNRTPEVSHKNPHR